MMGDMRDTVTTVQFRDWLEEQKQDPEFMGAYDALAAEYQRDRQAIANRTCDTCAYWIDDFEGHGLCEATWAKGSVPGAIWSRAVARNKTGRGTCWLETAGDYGCNQWRQAGEG